MKTKHTMLKSHSHRVATAVLLTVLPLGALAFQADYGSSVLSQTAKATNKPVAAGQSSAAQLAEAAGVSVDWDAQLGTPTAVRGRDLSQRQSFSGGKGLTAKGGGAYEQDAIAVMDNLARLYLVQDAATEFTAKPAEHDKLGFQHVRLSQAYQGIPVVGGDVIVHFDRNGQAYQVNGQYVADIQVSVTPQITGDQAVRAAQADLAAIGKPTGSLQGPARLVIYARNVAPQLAYELTLSYKDATAGPGKWRYWIDARLGTVLVRYNDIKRIAAPTTDGATTAITGDILAGEGGLTVSVNGWLENSGIYYLTSTNFAWLIYNVGKAGYPDNNTYAYRNTADWAATDPVEMSLGRNFEIVQSFYKDVMGLDSFNGLHKLAKANAHLGINFVNAYWDGAEFYFGDGDGMMADSLAVLDVAGHEFTHAVTEYSANLVYAYESGALNESFSDVMGTSIEFYGQADGSKSYPNRVAGQSDWLCGEDCWLSSIALRDLRNPHNATTVGAGNEQPSRYKGKYWYTGSGDNGGVHQNSGVQNFFYYLLCEGGSGTNDGIKYAVTGIGITNAQQVAFRALTVYCTPNTDYWGVRTAWISAAMDLNTNWVPSVSAAWAAVGIVVKPTITQQPVSLTVLSGSSAIFSVVATGSEPLGYQWLKDAVPVAGATTNPFTLFPVQTNNAGRYSVVVANSAGSATSSNATLTVIPTVPLRMALNNSNLNWTTDTNYPWYGQTLVSHDGVASAQSGLIGAGQQTALRTTINGPVTLRFWWKVSSAAGSGALNFAYDGQAKNTISGEVDWEERMYYIPAGSHALAWTYARNAAAPAGQDHGWVDEVSYVSGGTPPFLTLEPVSHGGLLGSTVTLTGAADGTPVLSYRWTKNGTTVSGATTPTLTLSNLSPAQQGTYALIVSNTYGIVTSSNAVVTIIPIKAWGNNQFGQTEVPVSATNVISVSAGGYHSLGLRADGRVIAWGNNYDGQCDAPATLTNAIGLAGGAYHSLALTADGRVVAWGANYNGQTSVPAGLTNIVAVAAGARHSLALRSNGRVVGWGDGTWNQLAIPSNLTNAVAIAASGNHCIALRSNGTVTAWGDNLNSFGSFAGQSVVPVGLSTVSWVSAGDSHSLSIDMGGKPTLWGDGTAGQLGTPPLPSAVSALSGGAVHTLAIVSNGLVAAWGDNLYGQGSIPSGLTTAVAISAGSYHNLALVIAASPVGPALPTPVRVGQQVRFSVTPKRGQMCILEYKNSLTDQSWTWLTSIVGDGTTRILTDSPGQTSQRFYRMQYP